MRCIIFHANLINKKDLLQKSVIRKKHEGDVNKQQ